MNLYVENLASNVRPADLQHILGGLGYVLYAKLPDEQGKGYAFVHVPNDDNARNVVASLNGSVLNGEKLTVTPMMERPGVISSATKK